MIVAKGATDITLFVNLVDSTDGVTPETGLTITTIDASYARVGSAAVQNDLTALAAITDAHSDNKGIEVDATNMPGLYRVDFPDAAFATGSDKAMLCVRATGVKPEYVLVDLVNYNSQDGTRLGLTALPNAAADAAGGLPISDAGGLDMDDLKADVTAILDDTATSGVVVASINAGAVTASAIASNAIDADSLAADAITEIQSGLSTLTTSQVNAEVVDALNVDTYAEVGQENPAATQTIRKMLAYLYKAWRNKSTQTASQYSLFADDAATVDQKATAADDGTTFTKGEVATGP